MKRNGCFWLIGCLLALLLAGCSSAASSNATPASSGQHPALSTPANANLGDPNCKPASPVVLPPANGTPAGGVDLPQIEGSAPGGQLWALVFNGWPMPARAQDKIVWRMTGSGDLRLVARGPGGQVLSPTDLVRHGSSNWQRPGEEWGSVFTFPVSGCWNIHATRDTLSGDVWFFVGLLRDLE